MFEEQLLEKVNICQEILQDSKNELYLNMRFFGCGTKYLSVAGNNGAGTNSYRWYELLF